MRLGVNLQVAARHTPVKASSFVYMDGLVTLSSNGQYYGVYWDDLIVLSTRDGKGPAPRPVIDGARAAAIDDRGHHLAIGTTDGRLVVLRPDQGEQILERNISETKLVAVAISSQGDRVSYLDDRGQAGMLNVRP